MRKGDSLWIVARRNGVTVNKLARWNGISRNAVIRPGQRLVVWGKPKAKSARSAKAQTVTHVVRKGDSLWAIAHRYQISTKVLAKANGISVNTVLRPGMKLKVPGASNATKTNAARTAPKPTTYTVRSGDSLWVISKRFKVSVASLRQWNNLSSRSRLQPGQELRVYAAQTKKT